MLEGVLYLGAETGSCLERFAFVCLAYCGIGYSGLFSRKRSEGQKGAEVIVAKRGQVAVRS